MTEPDATNLQVKPRILYSSPTPSENRNKPGIRDLLRGFWASRWTRSGEPIP